MGKGPGLYSDIGKRARDLLHRDYQSDQKFTITTYSPSGVALLVVSDWELAEARKKDALERARVRGEQLPQELIVEDRGLHASVEADVKKLLHGKTYDELQALKFQIESQMRSGTAKVVTR